MSENKRFYTQVKQEIILKGKQERKNVVNQKKKYNGKTKDKQPW